MQKGYPSQMADHFSGVLSPVAEKAAICSEEWAHWAQYQTSVVTADVLEAATARIEASQKDLDESAKDIATKVKELKKMAG